MTWSPWTRKAKAKAFSFYDAHTYTCLYVCLYAHKWRMCRIKTKDQTRNLAAKEQKPLTSTSTPPQAFQIARILSARTRERKSKRSCRGRRVCLGLISHLRSLLSLVWPRRSAWGSDSHTSGESRAEQQAQAQALLEIASVCMCVLYLHNAYCLFVFVFAFISTFHFTIVAWFLRLFLLRRSFYCSFLQQVWPHCALCIELHSPHMKRATQERERESLSRQWRVRFVLICTATTT